MSSNLDFQSGGKPGSPSTDSASDNFDMADRSDTELSSLAPDSTKTFITVCKPIWSSVDLTAVRTSQEAYAAIQQSHPEVINECDGLKYELHDMERNFVVCLQNGTFAHCRPNETLQTLDMPELVLTATIPKKFPIKLQIWRSFPEKIDPIVEYLSLENSDDCWDLQTRIEANFGYPRRAQVLEYNDEVLMPSDRLTRRGIRVWHTISITVKSSIYFKRNDGSELVEAYPKSMLHEVLDAYAAQSEEDLSRLRFQFHKTSGPSVEAVLDWLETRSDIVDADMVLGTVEENGLKYGDIIQVFRTGKKRNGGKKTAKVCGSGRVLASCVG